MNVTKSITVTLDDEELQALNEDEPLQVPLDGQILVLQPPRQPERERVEEVGPDE